MTRATLTLTHACDNHCVFCAQAGLAPLPPLELERALQALRADTDELTFCGGEPTLLPALPDAVRAARRLGFARVGLQTNGRRLADAALTGALAAAGLTDVHLTVLGADAAAHDYHSGTPGSFAELLRGVAAVRARGLPAVATTVLTRSNFRALGGLPALLSSRGVSAWCVAVPLVAGRAVAAMDRVVPPLALALPYALHALEAARRLNLPAYVQGAPRCLLGPFAARALPSAPRAFAPGCEACPSRASCPGVDGVYLARFGPDELTPQAPAAGAATGDELARAFTGPGELALPGELKVPPPPAEVRRGLKELGKGVPAAQEVRGAAPQSGDALKEIFPKLFGGE